MNLMTKVGNMLRCNNHHYYHYHNSNSNNISMMINMMGRREYALRPRKALMQLTDRASNRIKELIESKEVKPMGIRLGIKNRGCSGQSYVMDYAFENNIGRYDEKVVSSGITIYVDPAAQMFLVNTVMDFVEDDVHQGFVFENPNVSGSCGCGESVTYDKETLAKNAELLKQQKIEEQKQA